MTWTIDNARSMIVSGLNRHANDFPELKKEMFYYDEELKCFTSKGKHKTLEVKKNGKGFKIQD